VDSHCDSRAQPTIGPPLCFQSLSSSPHVLRCFWRNGEGAYQRHADIVPRACAVCFVPNPEKVEGSSASRTSHARGGTAFVADSELLPRWHDHDRRRLLSRYWYRTVVVQSPAADLSMRSGTRRHYLNHAPMPSSCLLDHAGARLGRVSAR
jgi:hypothetical protein